MLACLETYFSFYFLSDQKSSFTLLTSIPGAPLWCACILHEFVGVALVQQMYKEVIQYLVSQCLATRVQQIFS